MKKLISTVQAELIPPTGSVISNFIKSIVILFLSLKRYFFVKISVLSFINDK